MYQLDLIFGTGVDKSEIKKVESQLDALYKKYQKKSINVNLNTKDSTKNVKDLTNSTKDLDKTTKNYKKTADDASKSSLQFGNRMKTAIASTIEWTIAVGGLYAVINKMKESVEFTTQFDTSLTEIAMVTGRTREETAGLKDEYLELGEVLKVSSLELANSAVALYRQGLAAQEVNDRLSEISKTAKVAGLSVEEVTKFVTSGTNAMKVSAQEFNDVLLKVSSVAATDYQKLGEAFQKSATGFLSAGFSMEKAAGALATIQEVTQESATSIGTSMKTILARFGKLTDTGEDNTKVLNDIDKALQAVGLTLRGMDGQLRPTAEVLDELALIWDDLNINQKSYLGTTIAGARQLERFRVLMENYGRAIEITDQAYQASGTTQEQYLKFQESIQGKLNELQVAWEKLYDSMLDEGTIEKLIELAISLVETTTVLSDNIGLLNLAFIALTATMNVKTMSILPSLALKFGVLAESMGVASGAALSLGTALSGIIAGVAIVGIVKGIDYLITTSDEAMESVKSLKREINNLSSDKGSVETLAEEFDVLKNNTNKSLEEQERFVDIQNQIGEIMPSAIAYYDEQGNAVIRLSENYTTLTAEMQSYLDLKNEELRLSAQTGLDSIISDTRSERERLETLREGVARLNKEIEDGTFKGDNPFGLLKEFNDSIKEITDSMSSESDLFDQFVSNIVTTDEAFYGLTESARQYVAEQLKNIDITNMSDEELKKYIQSVLNTEEYIYRLIRGQKIQESSMEDVADSTEDLKNSYYGLKNALSDFVKEGKLTDDAILEIIESEEILKQVTEGNLDPIVTLAKQYGLSTSDMESFLTTLTDTAIKKAKLRLLSINAELDVLQKLSNMYNADNPAMDIFGDSINKYSKLNIDMDISSGKLEAENQLSLLEDLRKQNEEIAKTYGKVSKSAKETTTALKEYDSTMDDLNRKIHAYNLLVEQQSTYDLDNYVEQIESAKDVIEEIEELLELGYQDWSKMSLGTEEYRQQEESLRKLEIDRYEWMQKINASIKERNSLLLDAEEDITKLVIQGIKDRDKALEESYKNEIDLIEEAIEKVEESEKEKLEIKKKYITEGYEAQKRLLDKEYEDARRINEETKKQEELTALELKLGYSMTEKERYDLEKEIESLRTEIYEDSLKSEYELQKEALENEQSFAEDRVDTQLKAIEDRKNSTVENTEIMIQLEGKYTSVSVSEARRRLEVHKASLESIQNSNKNYLKEAESIIKGGSNSIYNFLKNNLDSFSSYTKKMIDELNKSLGMVDELNVSRGGGGGTLLDKYQANPKTSGATSSQMQANAAAQKAREELVNAGYTKGMDDISSHGAEGAEKWYNDYVKDRADLDDNTKDAFKTIVESKKKWDESYHNGGVVGGDFDPQTEQVAKLLKGEFVLSKSMINSLINDIIPNVAGLGATLGAGSVTNNPVYNINMNGVNIANDMDVNNVAESITSRINRLNEVTGNQTQRVTNSRR